LLVERVLDLGRAARCRRGVGRLVRGISIERIQRSGIIGIVRVVGNVQLVRLDGIIGILGNVRIIGR
jgi:hypothetical protein